MEERYPLCVLHEVCPSFDPESVMCRCLSAARFCGHGDEVVRPRVKLLDSANGVNRDHE